MGNDNKVSRKDFLKKSAVAVAAVAVAAKFGNIDALATPTEEGGQVVGAVPPSDKTKSWIDTTAGGVQKYWDGQNWVPVKSTWA